MACIICYSSLLDSSQCNTTNSRVNGDASGTDNKYKPAALGCGHTFHKLCIQEWFTTSRKTCCPICHRTHEGPILVLYIDEFTPTTGSVETTRTNNNSETGTNTTIQRSNADSTQGNSEKEKRGLLDCIEKLETLLYRQTLAMGRHTEERNSLETRLLIRENNIVSSSRRVNELKTTISRLEYKVEMSGIVSASYRSRIRTLERKLTESEAYVEELTERLEEAEEVEGLKENIEELNVYIDRLEIKAEEQRKHINSLERNLQTTEEYLYEANEEIRCFNDLSDAQQSQILSFQRSVEDKNAIICGHEYELEEEAGKAYDDIYYCQR